MSLSSRSFDWTRYWYRAEHPGRQNSESVSEDARELRGFLLDPEHFEHLQERYLKLPKLGRESQLTVLLGEPGMGKTTELKAFKSQLEGDDDIAGVTLLTLLGESDESGLAYEIERQITAGLDGQEAQPYFVLLDGLDECNLNFRNVLRACDRAAKGTTLHACLHIIVSCRESAWGPRLENAAETFGYWESTERYIYRLAPLRSLDVHQAAEASDLDPLKFLNNVRRRGVVSLARKPKSLLMLLQEAHDGAGELPDSRFELYEHGCLRLAKEENSHRVADSQLRGRLTEYQRMLIAGRIAAAMRFSGRRVFSWSHDNEQSLPYESIQSRSNDKASFQRRTVEVPLNTDTISEVLDSALFRTVGQEQYAVEHEDTADFLAAWYVAHKVDIESATTTERLRPLIEHDCATNMVPTALHACVGWLAAAVPAVFELVLKWEPGLFLNGDLSQLKKSQRKDVVARLLERTESWELAVHDANGLHHLDHPDLSVQLTGWIADSSKSDPARRLAMALAGACELEDCANELLCVALCAHESANHRVHAIKALSSIGDHESLLKLTDIAIRPSNDQPNLVRWTAARALHPAYISTRQVLESLSIPEDFAGPNSFFILYTFPGTLDEKNLIDVLDWLSQYAGDRTRLYEKGHHFTQFVTSLFAHAWNRLEAPDIALAFGRAVAAWLIADGDEVDWLEPRHQRWEQVSQVDATARQRFLIELVRQLCDHEDAPAMLADFLNQMSALPVLEHEINWILDRINGAENARTLDCWAHILLAVVRRSDEESWNSLETTAAQADPAARDIIAGALSTARTKRERAGTAKLEREKHDESKHDELHQVCNEATNEKWDTVIWKAFSLSNGAVRLDEMWEQLEILVVRLDAGEQLELIKAAYKYLDENCPADREKSLAGCFALLFIDHHDTIGLASIEGGVLDSWLPLFVKHLAQSPFGLRKYGVVYQQTRDLIIQRRGEQFQTLGEEYIEGLSSGVSRGIHSLAQQFWSERTGQEFRRRLEADETGAFQRRDIFVELLQREDSAAHSYAARTFARLHELEVPTDRQPDVMIANQAIRHSPGMFWTEYKSLLNSNITVGEVAVQALAKHLSNHFFEQLEPSQIEFLYRWIYKHLDPTNNANEQVFGDAFSLISKLRRAIGFQGTKSAVKHLDRLIAHFEDAEEYEVVRSLQWARVGAVGNLRSTGDWTPPSPIEVLRILDNAQTRLVSNSEQLRDVVIESLRRLEREWQGVPPAVRELWNEEQRGAHTPDQWSPKHENELSNRLVLHLRRDLQQHYRLIVNREVEVQPRVEGIGDRIDIKIQSVDSDDRLSFTPLSLMIEVKGCWHADLVKAIETQLLQDYLDEDGQTHGLYVVGWYYTPLWDDSKKGKARRNQNTIAEQLGTSVEDWQAFFDAQAERLSRHGNDVRAIVLNASVPEGLGGS